MKVKVEIERGRIYLRAPYSPVGVAKCKSVPGASWAKENKAWTYPLSISTCHLLREQFGDELEIGPELWKWAADKNKIDKQLKVAGSAKDADLKFVPKLSPKMAEAMSARTYQRSGAAFLALRRRAGNLDRPGLGKTIMAFASMMEAGLWGEPALVISPSTSLKPTWERQIHEWTDAAVFDANAAGSAEKREAVIQEFFAATGPRFLLVNPEMLQVKYEPYCSKCECTTKSLHGDQKVTHFFENHKATIAATETKYPSLFSIEWPAIFADECDYLLPVRPRRGRAKAVAQRAEGCLDLRSRPDGLRIAMTGTPLHGREHALFGLLHWARSDQYTSFWNYIDTYFNKDSNGFGVEIRDLRADREEMFYNDMDINFLRRTREEVRADLPTNLVSDVWVEMPAAQAKIYKDWATAGIAELEGGTIEGIGVLQEITRARQLAYGLWRVEGTVLYPRAESPKLEWLLGALAERGIDREHPLSDGSADKVVVVSQFTKIIDFIYDELQRKGIPALRITGAHKKGTSGKSAAEEFNSPGGARVLLLNTDAGGVSLTLDEYCDEMFILDEKYIFDQTDQVMGRIDNRGTRVAVKNYYFVRTAGTIDEGIAMSNVTQQEMQRDLLDRRRGVNIAARIIAGKGVSK